MNGWQQKGLVGLIGAAIGAAGILLTLSKMHDVGVGALATQDVQVQELMTFKAKIEKNVEEWRGDQAAYRLRMEALEHQATQASKERAAMFRWMERVSMKIGVDPPVIPQSEARLADRPGIQAAQ
jgi:hypothetical protein